MPEINESHVNTDVAIGNVKIMLKMDVEAGKYWASVPARDLGYVLAELDRLRNPVVEYEYNIQVDHYKSGPRLLWGEWFSEEFIRDLFKAAAQNEFVTHKIVKRRKAGKVEEID